MQNIYYHGKIITMEEETPYVEAVAVKDGKIFACGSKEALRKQCEKDWNWIDLQGHVMLPGLIDSHSHFSGAAIGFTQIDLGGADSYAEVRRRTQQFLEEFKPKADTFVLARNFEPYVSNIRENFTMEQLNEAAKGHPFIIQHKSGHMGWMNEEALKRLEITEALQHKSGGYVGICEGKLTGYLEEQAFVENLRRVPFYTPGQILPAAKKAQEQYASYGITTVQEGYVVPELEQALGEMVDSGILKLDYVWYMPMESWAHFRDKYPQAEKKYHRHLKLAGCKTFLDGSPQGRTAWLTKPYEGSEEKGYPAMKDEELEKICAFCMQEDLQLLVHCNGDAACQQYVDVYGRVYEKYQKDIRPVLVHAQMLQESQMDFVKKYHMIPSFFVSHVYHWGELHVKNLGWERAKVISPLHTAKKKDIPFTIHTDAPVIAPDLLEAVWCAVNRMEKNGTQLGGDECVTVYDALCAVTKNAAYQYGEEGEKGTIAVGKRADFVILEENPLAVKKECIRKIQVLETIKDGESIYRKRM